MIDSSATEARADLTHLLKTRGLALLALTSTLLLLILSLTQSDQQVDWLYKDNGIVVQHLQVIYALLALVLVVVVRVEPRLRRELREAHALAAVVLIAVVVSFLVVRIIKPDEAWRFFRSPPLLWFMVAHGVFLSGLAVLLALENPQGMATARMRRYALIAVIAVVLGVIVLHLLSVENFVRFNMPDEVWLGSLATNLAHHGQLYSSYLMNAYGNPQPAAPYFYVLMSLWLRLTGESSLLALRAFPLLVAGIGVALVALLLWRARDLSTLQRSVGIAVLLVLTSFIRTAHDLRMDAGFVVYGAIVLLGLLSYLQSRRLRWLLLSGGALYLGMEVVPTVGIVLNGVIGLVLVGDYLLHRVGRWRDLLGYAAACAGAGGVFFVLHFLPDPALKLSEYSAYTTHFYAEIGKLTLKPFGFLDFINISSFLSPVEIVVVGAVVAITWRLGLARDRLIVVIFAAAALVLMTLGMTSYGYLVVLAPFIAYFSARALTPLASWSRGIVILGVFVLLPALISAPVYDMTTAMQEQSNQRLLAEVDLLSWRIPDGATVWADPLFWFTLEDRVTFVGRTGPEQVALMQGISLIEAVKSLGVDVVICADDDPAMCALGEQLFGDPYVFQITDRRFLMYSALGSS